MKKEKILWACLNWGMGHVARSIPLLLKEHEKGNEIWLACHPTQQTIFEQYLPEAQYLPLLNYPFQFKGKGNFILDLFVRLPQLLKAIRLENTLVEEWVSKYQFTKVISDHRYGFRSTKVKSIFITHQVHLPLNPFYFLAQRQHRSWMKKFDEIWVLDTVDSKFAGALSKPLDGLELSYIGPQSRFEDEKLVEKDIPFVAVVSGPLIYAQQFVNELIVRNEKIVFLLSTEIVIPSESHHLFIQTDDWLAKDAYMRRAEKIISRSGYSTIMDVYFLQAKYEFIPTPGQWEQVYLKEIHKD